MKLNNILSRFFLVFLLAVCCLLSSAGKVFASTQVNTNSDTNDKGAISSPRLASQTNSLNLKPILSLSALPTDVRSTSVSPSQKERQRTDIPSGDTSQAVKIVIALTVLAILPSLLICLTSFLRTIIVLSMLRHAIGMQETPPNSALIGVALFLTMFTMAAPLQTVNQDAFQPYMEGTISAEVAYERAAMPIREFMVRQTREQDLALMVELSKAPQPSRMEDISNVQLIPAFMLSELRSAFQIGFVIFLPFLLIDLIVSSVLMALGMMMMPPVSIALPLKILMFILVDGWNLILRALVGSFH